MQGFVVPGVRLARGFFKLHTPMVFASLECCMQMSDHLSGLMGN